VLAAAAARRLELETELTTTRASRDEIAAEERRHSDEAELATTHAEQVERRLYSGEVTAPKELESLQADLEQLRRRQRMVEDHQLAAMERREPVDARLGELEAELAAATRDQEAAQAALATLIEGVDAELETEGAARAELAAALDAALVADYETCRAKANGVGAARLVGTTCQGCHLSIPATEVDRIRRAATTATIEHCDNCGCILVP